MEEKLLSVIIPVYKVEKYLKRCVDSIISQTYKNLQIILVDDGSPDNCGPICDEYTQKDKRIIVIHQENEGLSGARNSGILFAKGDYIAFVDSDDWIHPQMYEVMMNAIKAYDLDIVRTSVCETDGKEYKKNIQPSSNVSQRVIEGKHIFPLYFTEFLCKVVWNAVYKKEVVQGIISPERCQFEDNYVSGRYLYRAKRMMILPDILYYYWMNPNGISNSSSKRLLDICICTKMLKVDLLQEGLRDSMYIKRLDYKLARELYHYIRVKDSRWRVEKIDKNLKSFILSNLDFGRKLRFMLLLHRLHIKILGGYIMAQKYNTPYFEKDTQLYKEKFEFLYKQDTDTRDALHISFNINDLFFPPLGAEITSILETNKDIAFNFYVFVDSCAETNKVNLQKTAEKYKCNIRLYIMDMSIFQDFHIKVKRFSRVTYIRIVMPWILRHYTDRYLYLDSDMICVGSLRLFLDTDLGDKAIGALTYPTPDRVAFLKMKQDVYFSDGLMWINVVEWIKQKVTEQVFSYQGADPRRFKGQTQDLLNLVMEGNIKPMPHLFHHMDKDFSVQGILIHYSGRDKPWEIVLDEDDELWRHYLDISFWPSMPNPMPPKTPEFYHSFKKLAKVYSKKGQKLKELECLFWYSVLKIRKKL